MAEARRIRGITTFLAAAILILGTCGPAGLAAQELCTAVRSGDVAEVKKLLASGSSLQEIEAWGTEERTALMVAADQMDQAMFSFLLSRGAPINQVTPENRRTLLMHLAGQASTYDETRLPLARLILSRGASPDLKDSNGWTALRHGVESGAGSPMLVLLLSFKADPDLGDTQEIRPLHQAVETGQDEAVKALLVSGANPDLLMRQGRSKIGALHLAVDKAQYETVKLLLGHGANINLQTTGSFGGQTALHRSVENRDPDMVRLLLGYKPRLDIKDAGGYTALDYAREGGGSEVEEIQAALAKIRKS